jgi:hypothetical protein
VIVIENFLQATSQLAQTTLRSVLGKHMLDEMLAERDQLNADIQEILDRQTEAWGVKVTNVEIKQVDLDHSMVRAIARQAEAERTRRAKVINAEGEQQAAEKLVEAAQILAQSPGAMQLRYLATLSEIASERTSAASCSNGVRDLLKSLVLGIGHSTALITAVMVPSPRCPPHSFSSDLLPAELSGGVRDEAGQHGNERRTRGGDCRAVLPKRSSRAWPYPGRVRGGDGVSSKACRPVARWRPDRPEERRSSVSTPLRGGARGADHGLGSIRSGLR